MKIQYILLGLKDCPLATGVSLSGIDLDTYSEYFVVGKNEGMYNTHIEAMNAMLEIKNKHGYDGFKIDMIYYPE